MTYKVAVADTFYFTNVDVLRNRLAEHGIQLDVFDPQIDDPSKLAEYDVVVSQHYDIKGDVVGHLDPNVCRIVIRTGVGYDEFDLQALSAKGIWAANVPGYGPNSVGQHTMQHIYDLAGHTIQYHDNAVSRADLSRRLQPDGTWEDIWMPDRFIKSKPIYTSTLAICGFGRIGRRVAELARSAFGRIIVRDPYVDDTSVYEDRGVERVESIEEFLGMADFLTLHVPLFKVPQDVYVFSDGKYHHVPGKQYQPTARMIGAEQFAMMEQKPFLINTCRGEVVVESDLVEAIETGQIRGVALDVYEEEPPARYHILRKMAKTENIILTFHSAFCLEGVPDTVLNLTADEIIRLLIDDELPHHLVNPWVLEREG